MIPMVREEGFEPITSLLIRLAAPPIELLPYDIISSSCELLVRMNVRDATEEIRKTLDQHVI